MDFNQIISKFQAEMLSRGITPPQYILADSQLNRFHVQRDARGSKNGWYALFTDNTPCGVFGNWKIGSSYRWCSKRRDQMSNKEFSASVIVSPVLKI